MATADSVKAKMQGLIDSANAKTGGNDTTLTGAVNALIAGYGQGGGGSSGGTSGIYMAKITPESDAEQITVNHNLGTTDILFAAILVETLGDIVPTSNGTLAKFYAKSDIPFRITSTSNSDNFNNGVFYNATNAIAQPGSMTSLIYTDVAIDENTFEFKRVASAYKFIAGVTYTVIIVAASAFSEV
jgi:hypothetical protein